MARSKKQREKRNEKRREKQRNRKQEKEEKNRSLQPTPPTNKTKTASINTAIENAVKTLPLPTIDQPGKENEFAYYYDAHTLVITFFHGKSYDDSGKRGKAVFHPENFCWVLSKINSNSKLKKTKAGHVIAKVRIATSNGSWQTIIERRTVKKKAMGDIIDMTALYNDDVVTENEVLCSGDSIESLIRQTAEQIVRIMAQEL